MPHRKLARRFEPRYGVNQTMLDMECKWVARELEDYLLLSINDLRAKQEDRQSGIHVLEQELEQELEQQVRSLKERDRLALRCMFLRDVFHIGQLYLKFLRSRGALENEAAAESGSDRRDIPDHHDVRQKPQEPFTVLPFKSTLFE